MRDFISEYLHYCRGTEVPVFYNRWCAILGIAGVLGRNSFVKFGASEIYPNMYCMLMGESGARKSTAIKGISRILKKLGYVNMAPAKSSKEGFTLELSELSTIEQTADNILDQNLFGGATDNLQTAEIFVAADEFNNFIGLGNTDFASFLGDMWDYEGIFKYKLKNSKPIYFKDATVNILGGNTIENLMECFPPNILSQGFFSRMIFVHCEKLNIRIHDPRKPSDEETAELLNFLNTIHSNTMGEFLIPADSVALLKRIYDGYKSLDDIRFKSYSNRRYTHLLKMCMICSAARGTMTVTPSNIIYANTILNYTEQFMPKALGEFGASRSSGVAHKIVNFVDAADGVVDFKDVWKHVYQDLDREGALSDIIRNLVQADRIQIVGRGFLPNKKGVKEDYADLIDYSLLTDEERKAKV